MVLVVMIFLAVFFDSLREKRLTKLRRRQIRGDKQP
jgi:hypothetical protein